MKKSIKNYKSFLEVIFSAALTVLCLSILCSCGKDEPDLSGISEIPGTFLEAVKNLDRYAAFECSPEFASSEWDEFNEGQQTIIRTVLSYAEITEVGDPVFYEESGTVDLDVSVSYISFDDVMDLKLGFYLSETGLTEALDAYDETHDKTITLEFEYNESDSCWKLTKSSARKICRLFNLDKAMYYTLVDNAPDDAEEIFMSYLKEIAECTDADTFPDVFDLEDYRYYDDSLVVGEGSRTEDAVARFAAAYMNYVLSHDPYIRAMNYEIYLDGQAPARIFLRNALSTDEYNIQHYANILRYMYSDMDIEELADIQTALIYDTLAEAIPDSGSEDYLLSGRVSLYNEEGENCTFYDDLILKPLYDTSTEFSEEQFDYYIEEAIYLLHENGEADDELYETMLENAPDLETCFTFDTEVSKSGHSNQAVGTYSYVPSWCTDGSLFYGGSESDDQGWSMSYTGEPTWLDLVGYSIDEEGIWISCYFDRIFFPTNEVIADWWVDGELTVDTQIVLVGDFTNEIEVFLPVDELPESVTYELRLWETNHRHVIAYVTITR